METLSWIFIIIGLIGLFFSFHLVYNELYTAQLSMSIFRFSPEEETKEHHSGLSWKWLWFKLQQPIINMKASIIITSGGILLMDWEKFISQEIYKKIPTRIYETEDGILYGSWATAIRPAKGFLNRFILKTPQVGALMTMSLIDLKISDNLAKTKTGDALKKKEEISDFISKIFGGNEEEADSSHEKTYGLIVSNPQLFDLNLGEKSQAAAEKLFEVTKFQKSMEVLKEEISDPEKRANAIFIANSLVKKKIWNIEGLENATANIAQAFASAFFKKS